MQVPRAKWLRWHHLAKRAARPIAVDGSAAKYLEEHRIFPLARHVEVFPDVTFVNYYLAFADAALLESIHQSRALILIDAAR